MSTIDSYKKRGSRISGTDEQNGKQVLAALVALGKATGLSFAKGYNPYGALVLTLVDSDGNVTPGTTMRPELALSLILSGGDLEVAKARFARITSDLAHDQRIKARRAARPRRNRLIAVAIESESKRKES